MEKPYKIINREGCLAQMPEKSYYINEDMKIINYCNSFCKKCSNFDKCNECYNGYKMDDNGKCIEKDKTFIYLILGVIAFIMSLLILLAIHKIHKRKILKRKEKGDSFHVKRINLELIQHDENDKNIIN